MNDQRRTILKGMTAMAAASVSGLVAAKQGYDPKAKFELKVSEVPFRKNAKGRQLMARIYQPTGAGPFPVLLDPGRKVNTAFMVEGIPKSFIFDREGRLAAQAIDLRTESQFLELLKLAGLE